MEVCIKSLAEKSCTASFLLHKKALNKSRIFIILLFLSVSLKGIAKIVRSRNNKSDAEFWNVYNFINWFDGYNCYCYNKRQ